MHELHALKRDVFYKLMNAAGRVYIHVRNSDRVDLGRRGFKGDEKEKGIVLVLNSSMRVEWNEHGLDCTLVFGTTPEKCFIPSEDVVSVYSPELGVQYICDPEGMDEPDDHQDADDDHPHGAKVIKVDFSGKRKKGPGTGGR